MSLARPRDMNKNLGIFSPRKATRKNARYPKLFLRRNLRCRRATPPPDTIFRGPHGIRAGWRVLLFLALAASCYRSS